MKWLVLVVMVVTVFSSRPYDERERERRRKVEVEDREYGLRKATMYEMGFTRREVARSYSQGSIIVRKELK